MINSQQKVPGASSVDSPAATTNGDNYVLAWTTGDQSIWWTTCPASSDQNSYDWVKPASIPNAASSGGPALAELAGKAWMAWKGEGTDTRIFISSLSGSTWSPGVPISGVSASSSPALAATASELYLAWKGDKDNTIYWSKSSDGKAWSAQKKVPGAASSDAPALAAFKDAVYLAWKGESDAAIWFSEYSDAKGWGTAKSLRSDFETSRGPGLGVGNTGNLHLVWKGKTDNFVWESVLWTGKTDWSPQAKIVTIETDGRPALASQTSSDTTILLAWKGGATNDVWAAPLDNLHKLVPLPPSTITEHNLTWDFPVGASAPASLSGAQYNVGFGSGPTQAAVAASLELSNDGKADYSGWYQDQGHIPIFDAPSQTYNAVIVVTAANKVIYTFTRSNNKGVPTGGAVDTWDVPQTDQSIAKNWTNLQPKNAKTGPQATVHFSCTNNSDLLSFLGELIQDVEKLVGWVEEAVEVVSVIASAA
jgi:hypothetical protein